MFGDRACVGVVLQRDGDAEALPEPIDHEDFVPSRKVRRREDDPARRVKRSAAAYAYRGKTIHSQARRGGLDHCRELPKDILPRKPRRRELLARHYPDATVIDLANAYGALRPANVKTYEHGKELKS